MQATTLSRTRRIELVLRQVDALPTLPAVASRLLGLTADRESHAQEVIDLVKLDPPLTARLIQLCRTADRGVRRDVATVDKAVLLLGFSAVRNAVLSAKVFELFERRGRADELAEEDTTTKGSAERFDRNGFWLHSLAVATAAQRIAELHRQGDLPADEAFVCGLLHDIGKLALDWVLPQAYDRVLELAELNQGEVGVYERQVIGLDHHTAGKRLAERWALPHRLQDAVWLHGSPYNSLPKLPHRRLVGLVSLADLIARRRHLGYSGNFSAAGDVGDLAEQLKLDPRKVEEACDDLPQRVARLAEGLGLEIEVSADAYLHSLQKANEALGRVNTALERRATGAAAQQRVLDAIGRFQSDSRPRRGTQDVIDAVARSAQELMGEGFYAVLLPARTHLQAPSAAFHGSPGDSQHGVPLSPADSAVAMVALDDRTPMGDEGPQPGDVEAAVWLLCHYDPMGEPIRQDFVEAPHGAPDLANFDARDSLNVTMMGVLPWIADHLVQADDLRRVQVLPLPSGWGTAALLLHDRPNLPPAPVLASLVATWGTALVAANQHEGARRLGEQLAGTNAALAEAQDRLLRQESMARLGEMAAGAAHEMNNPLANISGRAQLLTMTLDAGTKPHRAASVIFREAHRLSDLISSLRMFAEPPRARRVPTDLSRLVGDVVHRVGGAARKRREELSFALKLPGEMPRVNVDPDQVDRALSELLMNAVQANPRRGVTVSVKVVGAAEASAEPDEPAQTHPDVAGGALGGKPGKAGSLNGGAATNDGVARSGALVISVIDDGDGMDPHVLQHACDPFFSAKPAGRQAGLGLARVTQLAAAHGGRIDLRSTVGRGTTATLVLPLH